MTKLPAALIVVVLGVPLHQARRSVRRGDRGRHPARTADRRRTRLLDLGRQRGLIAGGMAVALIGFSEGYGAASAFARKHGDQSREQPGVPGPRRVQHRRGLTSGMVVGGSLSKSAANDSAKAKSQISNVVNAVLVVLTLLFLAPFFESLPEATLAAVVIAALWHSANPRKLAPVWTVRGRSSRSPSSSSSRSLTSRHAAGDHPRRDHLIGSPRLPHQLPADIGVGTRPGDGNLREPRGSTRRRADPRRRRVPIRIAAHLRERRRLLRRCSRSRRRGRPTGSTCSSSTARRCSASTTPAPGRSPACIDDMHERGVEVRLARVHPPARERLRTSGVLEKLGEDRMFRTSSRRSRPARDSGCPLDRLAAARRVEAQSSLIG